MKNALAMLVLCALTYGIWAVEVFLDRHGFDRVEKWFVALIALSMIALCVALIFQWGRFL